MKVRTKATALTLAVALFAVLAIFFIPRDRNSPKKNTVIAPLDAAMTATGASSLVEEPSILDQPLDQETTSRREAGSVNEEPPRSEVELCIVLGRVVDEQGSPLNDVAVRLHAYRLWAEGIDVPRLPGPYDMRGFLGSTNADGAFGIEAPPPTAARTTLEIRPDRFHDSYTLYFGSGRVGSQPPLTAGVVDLGEIRLATTGAVSGRVTAVDGRPLGGVKMGVGPGRVYTYGRDTLTEPDGTYVIGHAPIGTYAVKAEAEGFLSGYLEPVSVAARLDTAGVDFVLQGAPSIEGIVVDELGTPIEGAKLWGWPILSGSGAGAKSGVDGRFTVYLPQSGPYTMTAKCDGYRTWGEDFDRSITFEPGTRDLEIVMETTAPAAALRFLVVDAKTGERLTRFGLNILANNGSKSTKLQYREWRPPQQEDHPDGVVERTGRPGIDAYVVFAAGYRLDSGDVELDSPDVPLQTLRMKRAPIVRGRVLRDGVPVSGAGVELARGSPQPDGIFQYSRAPSSSTRTDTEGRFELAALATGDHRLSIRPGSDAPLVVPIPRLSGEEVRELGDLLLLAGAEIDGLVLLPAGIDPAGLHVYLDDQRAGLKAVVDESRHFHFEELAAGTHTLTLEERPGLLAASESLSVELIAGRTTEVSLDASDRAMCSVTLTLEHSGQPAVEWQVDLIATDGSGEREILGNTDSEGQVTGAVRAWGEARIHVHAHGMPSVDHPSLRLHLRPMERVEEHVSFELARLRLTLPPDVSLPEDGRARIKLTPDNAPESAQYIHLRFVEGSLSGSVAEFARVDGGVLFLGGLYPGSSEVELRLQHETDEPVSLGGVRVLRPSPSYFSSTRAVILIVDTEQELRLE